MIEIYWLQTTEYIYNLKLSNVLLLGKNIPMKTVNISTIQWNMYLGKCKQYFNSNAIVPLLIPASMNIAIKGTCMSTVMYRYKSEYGNG